MSDKDSGSYLKREVLVKIIEAFYSSDFTQQLERLPFTMRPKNSEVPYRCCIHKERAILRKRTIAGIGFAIEDDNEFTPLAEYAKVALTQAPPTDTILTIIDTACQGCIPNRIVVTDLCQRCVSRACLNNCRFAAISFNSGKATIDSTKCRECGKCVPACPYQAISKLRVPCEESCPVKAINKTEKGSACIDFAKCISCGKCISACPFGAVQEKSQILNILKAIKDGKKLIAMLAPSIIGQFPGTAFQLVTALKKVGFDEVVEVAVGADITALNEASEFLNKDTSFMTTSCCSSYLELVTKHLSALAKFVSATKTPLYYTALWQKKLHPSALTVFIGPCLAKKIEGIKNPEINYVITYEELAALFEALKLDPALLSETKFTDQASREGRKFGVSGGVAGALIAALPSETKVNPLLINGLDKQTISKLQICANKQTCAEGNLIEVMACPGGCLGGPGVVTQPKAAIKQLHSYSEASKSLTEIAADKT